ERVPAQRLQRMDRGEPGPVRAHPAHAADDHRALAVRTSVMRKTTRRNDEGIALVFTLFLMASLSALAVSLMFLSQTETSSTRNYRTMSQARYACLAGVARLRRCAVLACRPKPRSAAHHAPSRTRAPRATPASPT